MLTRRRSVLQLAEPTPTEDGGAPLLLFAHKRFKRCSSMQLRMILVREGCYIPCQKWPLGSDVMPESPLNTLIRRHVSARRRHQENA